ncbi:MAG: NAD-dependent epimerase/dehydratase family protein [Gemmataceae bacterium]
MARCLITGATGFLGGHLAEACRARGDEVVALVRDGSDAAALERLGAAVVRGDMTRLPAGLLDGVEVVYHAAAKVGDWGPAEEYRAVNVEGLRGLLEACRGRRLRRFVHFSSLGVYAARHHSGTDESEPLPERHIDGYTQSKVEAELLALEYHRTHGVPVVILRPGFIYGPGDRTLLPKLVQNLRAGIVWWLGSGEQALNCIFIDNLVEAALLAADKDGVEGRVYNLTDGERVSKRQFINGVADGLGIKRPWLRSPLWLARVTAWWMEPLARALRFREPPRLTQARLKFLGLNLDFSTERARRELGYSPATTFERGLTKTLEWYRQAFP